MLHSKRSPSHLPEHPSAGIGTFHITGLPRFRRAGPSTSLDKSAAQGLLNCWRDDTMRESKCQTLKPGGRLELAQQTRERTIE